MTFRTSERERNRSAKTAKVVVSSMFHCLLTVVLIITFILQIGCANKNNFSNSIPQVSNQQVSEEPLSTQLPANTPLPNPINESTPTFKPRETEWFLFFPTDEQLKQLEIQAIELDNRLKQTTDGERDASLKTDYTTFQVVRYLSGDFREAYDQVKLGNTEFKKSAAGRSYNLLAGFNVTLGSAMMHFQNGDDAKSKIVEPNYFRIFEVAGLDKYIGAETLKIFEIETESLFQFGFQEANEIFTNKAKTILSLIDDILICNNAAYKGQQVTNLYIMHPIVRYIMEGLIYNTIFYIGTITDDWALTAFEESEYTLNDYFEILVELIEEDYNCWVEQGMFGLIDTYIACADVNIVDKDNIPAP